MKRSAALLLVAGLAACAGPRAQSEHTAAGATSNGAAERVLAIADAYTKMALDEAPLFATLLRIPGARYDELSDDSIKAIAERNERARAWLKELQAIDRRALDGSPMAQLAYDVARERLEARLADTVCRLELWAVSQTVTGWHIHLTGIAAIQPVETAELREQALARFSRVSGYVDTQIANLEEGLRLGYAAADINVKEVIEQIEQIAKAPLDSSPFMSPAIRDATPEFKEKMAAIVKDQIGPALARYREFLVKTYLPKARKSPGVLANPEGAACYRAQLRLLNSTSKTPEEIHALGVAALEKVEAEMKALAKERFATEDVRGLLDRFRTDKVWLYKDRDEMIAEAESAITRAKAAMPRAFHLMPKAEVTVEPIPPFEEKNSAPQYRSAALDGSRPARYRIRLYQPEKQSRALGETTAFHETIPGHHLQKTIADERECVPAIARYLWVPGFGEGWALYSERLADELGLFSNDGTRMGMLGAEAWRSVRLIVDTGIHALGWDRKKAIDLLMAHTPLSEDFASAEIDRYIAWPGQATAYMVGYLEIASLRERAKAQLKGKFDLRTFHDRILENGTIPLSVLRANVDRWLASEATP
jgi:uncharacterized protein (DUF885 family)